MSFAAYRHIAATNYNEQSSRSHTIFRLIIESKEKTNLFSPESEKVMISSLNLIDLAGSERVSTLDIDNVNQRRREGSYINKSLLTLANVISKLTDKNQEG